MRKKLSVLGVLAVCVLMLSVASPAFAATKATTYIKGLPSATAGIYRAVSYSAAGTLTYAKGTKRPALAYQYVTLYRYNAGKWSAIKKTKTNSKGQFKFTLPTGYSYQVKYAGNSTKKPSVSAKFKVQYPSMGVMLQSSQGSYGVGSSTSTTTASGTLSVSHPEFFLPVSGTTVKLYDGSYNYVGSCVTDANGKWSFKNLPAGDYRTVVSASSNFIYKGGHYKTAERVATFSVTVFTASSWVEVGDANNWQGFYYVYGSETSAAVNGGVNTDLTNLGGATEYPIAGATVTINKSTDNGVTFTEFVQTVVTDAEGNWATDLPVGDYRAEYTGTTTFPYSGNDWTVLGSMSTFYVFPS